MDRFEKLVTDSAYAVAILANPTLTDFEIVELQPVPAHVAAAYVLRGLGFIGVAGLLANGMPKAALDIEVDGRTAAALGLAFTRHVAAREGWVDPLEAMWSLEDPRQN